MAFEIKFTLDGLKDVQGLAGSIKRKLKDTLNKKLATDPLGYGTPHPRPRRQLLQTRIRHPPNHLPCLPR